MNAVVLLRAVPDLDAPGPGAPPLLVDTPSLVALGLALSWRAAHPKALITGLAVGPAEWEPALREALALELDTLIRPWIEGFEQADIPATAAALAAALPTGTSVVFAGSSASDHGTGLLPAALAELLGWPFIGSVTGIEPDSTRHAVRSRGEAGVRRLLALALPAVLQAAPAPAPSLYPRLRTKLAARKAPVSTPNPAPPAARLRLDGYGPARPVTRSLFRPSATARPAERLRQLMSGGMSNRGGKTLAAETGVAQQLADLLDREGLIRDSSGGAPGG